MGRGILLSPVDGQDIVVHEVFRHYRHDFVVAANLSAPYLAAETPAANTPTSIGLWEARVDAPELAARKHFDSKLGRVGRYRVILSYIDHFPDSFLKPPLLCY